MMTGRPSVHDAGWQSYCAEILRMAEEICGETRHGDITQSRLFHVRALLAWHDKQHAAAIACLKRAIRCAPECSSYYLDLSEILLEVELDDEAVASCLRAVTLDATTSATFVCLARALFHARRFTEAVALSTIAIRINPEDAAAYHQLGDALEANGQLHDAIEQHEAGVALRPRGHRSWECLGRARLQLGDCGPAAITFRQGLAVNPGNPTLLAGLGEALLCAGAVFEAARAFQAALSVDQQHLAASCGLVRVHAEQGAESNLVGAWLHLGVTLQTLSRHHEAAAAYQQALKLKSDCLGARFGLGRTWLARGRPLEAKTELDRALAVDAEHHEAHVARGQACWLIGDAECGWDGLGWQYRAREIGVKEFDCPIWDGGALQGRTILLWTDQGLGDSILFLRYISYVKSLGAQIVVQSHHRSLIPFVERMTAVDRVVAPGAPLPVIDCHAPLVYLPALVNPRPGIPGEASYLDVDPKLVRRWRKRVDAGASGRTIGVSWGGNAWHKSAPSRFIPLRMFGRLADVQGVHFVSLQHGPQTAELLSLPPGLHVRSVLDEDSPVLDVAAAILNLDIVISVDTMVAHLAGALGKPVWTLLRHSPDWRWGSTGDRTPWYPTMRLFRQEREGDWAGVFERVRATLETEAQSLGP